MNTLKEKTEIFLNEQGTPSHDEARVPKVCKTAYGTWLRKNDPIAFHFAVEDYENMING